MPLNKKGKKILKSMKEQYGSDAKKVFYASKNKGVIKNVENKMGGGLSGGKRSGPPPLSGPTPQGLKITRAYLGKEMKQPTETKKEFGTRHEVHTKLKESEIYRKGSKVSDASPMLKEGGMSCPYRRGGKTGIQGVSKIQVKGQKFTGVK